MIPTCRSRSGWGLARSTACPGALVALTRWCGLMGDTPTPIRAGFCPRGHLAQDRCKNTLADAVEPGAPSGPRLTATVPGWWRGAGSPRRGTARGCQRSGAPSATRRADDDGDRRPRDHPAGGRRGSAPPRRHRHPRGGRQRAGGWGPRRAAGATRTRSAAALACPSPRLSPQWPDPPPPYGAIPSSQEPN
jgi:hypothetical protein